jgi:DNA-binding transcriptional ArsR family regulator
MIRRPPKASNAPKAPKPLAGVRSLDRLEQVRVLAHPLRLRLLELFAESPRTTKQAADRLGLPPTRLYHHVAALERVGIVRVRETRPNRGTIEKYYEATAQGFESGPALLTHGKGTRTASARLANESVAALAMRIVERAGESLLASLDAIVDQKLEAEDPRMPLAVQALFVGTPKELSTMRGRLVKLLERWQARAKSLEGEKAKAMTMRASLTIVFAPEVPKESKESKESKARAKKTRTSGSGGRKPGGGT